eukprot:s785_g36.t1
MEQNETFKFGGPRLYPSTRALVAWLAIRGRWFLVKIAVVATQVPLLLSRPVLGQLGMHFKLDENMADFTSLGLVDVKLGYTASGHPRAEAFDFEGQPPEWPECLDWSVTEIHIPGAASAAHPAYTASSLSHGGGCLFYPKVHGHVEELLTRDILDHEVFMNWWNGDALSRDFWIETEHYLDRIHVTPRRTFFDPSHWRTTQGPLRDNLLQRLGAVRESTCIPCHTQCPTMRLEHHWHEEGGPRAEFLWIGRSRFHRKQPVPEVASPGPLDVIRTYVAMEDESGAVGGAAGIHGGALPSGGTSCHTDRRVGGSWTTQEQVLGDHSPLSGSPEGEVPGRRDRPAGEGESRGVDEVASREHAPSGQEVVCFGSYKGYMYKEVNEPYLQWAMEEVASNPQHSPDLARLARWAQARPMTGMAYRHTNPEAAPVVATPAGAQPKAKVKSTPAKTQRTARTRPLEPKEETTDFSEVEWPVEDQITDMEARLEVLKTIKAQEDKVKQEKEVIGSKSGLKKRAYWNKVDELVKLRRSMREANLPNVPDDEHSLDEIYDQDTLEVDEYDSDESGGAPKVNLKYPVDYDTVKNLPSKRMKRASRKRVTGWARRALCCLTTTLVALASPVMAELDEAVMAPLRDLTTAIVGHREREPVALLELFAGSAHLTTEFAARGYNVLEPRDILYGHDLFDSLARESVFNDIETMRPRLLWVALPCTMWSPWQRLNYAQRRQALRRARQKQRNLVNFAVEAAWAQVSTGGEVAFEHPRESDMWSDRSLLSLLDSPLVTMADLDMCRYNLRAVTDGGRLRKPTRILSSSPQLLEPLKLTCHGGHSHTPTQGRNTKPAGVYTKEFCQAVVQGYKKMSGTLWYHENDRTWEAMAVVVLLTLVNLPIQDMNHEVNNMVKFMVVPLEHEALNLNLMMVYALTINVLLTVLQNALMADTNLLLIYLDALVLLASLSLNMHLRLSGAGEVAVKAAHSLRCETCARHSGPGTRRPAKLVRALDFNHEVCLDTLNLFDAQGKKVETLSILDMATGYHIVKKITGRKSNNLLKDFVDAWVNWAGPPLRVTVDQERGFLKEFTDGLDMLGIQARVIAGQAHWQQGAVERQGQWYRAIWDKTIAHVVPTSEETDYTLAMVNAAKNNLRRSHGYSPTQWLFGAEPRLGDAMLDENEELYQLEELRALLGRSRVASEDYTAGDYVYIYRIDKTAGGKARQRQNVGEWIGPGVIIGKEGNSFWVSRGGRCVLCAPEHLRPAESEELGAAFQTKALKEDLMRVVANLEDEGNDEVFADATGAPAFTKRAVASDEVPERRMRSKGVARMLKREAPEGALSQPSRPAPALQREVEEPVEPEERDIEDLLDQSFETMMTERRVPRSLIKQNDKEIRWEDIPETEKELYLEAEKKQWQEHLRYEAVRVHPPADAELLRSKVPTNRILKARFAYRDKNVAKRRENPEVPAKAKARLCVGGHMDPDLRKGEVNTEAPTASKTSLFTLLFLAAQLSWRLAAGDVEAAFLNGIVSKRNLYFEAPRRGLPGVAPGSLIEIVKGVFGLANSPWLWWDKLAAELLSLEIVIGGEVLKLKHHKFDPCLFLLRDQAGEGRLRGALVTHVDDLLIAAPAGEMGELQQSLSKIFPIADWEQDEFEYTGSTIKQTEDMIEVHQKPYVNSRLETVELPAQYEAPNQADEVTMKDNMSTVGALSWLAAQSRPDLQAGVSLSQRKQKQPTYEDVKHTNKIVKMAQKGKDEPLRFTKLADDPSQLVLLVYHDAAWANAPLDPAVADAAELEEAQGHGVYSQLGHLLVLTTKEALAGRPSPSMIVGWKSHACPRVCRSTFAAETMAALGGWEDALAFRSYVSCAVDPEAAGEDQARELFPIVSLTDCKSLYDNVHRIGGPRAPSEKRLVVDLTALRLMVAAEDRRWATELPGAKTFRWLPTTHQLADILTKVISDVRSWWQNVRLIQLPFGGHELRTQRRSPMGWATLGTGQVVMDSIDRSNQELQDAGAASRVLVHGW